MIKKVFTIYDSKAELHSNPFFAVNEAIALRIFEDAVNDPQTNIYRHPSDHTLFKVGEFDDSKGTIIPMEALINLGLATEYKKEN